MLVLVLNKQHVPYLGHFDSKVNMFKKASSALASNVAAIGVDGSEGKCSE
jgi:hypothetical protein